MFHLALYSASIANGSVLLTVAPVADPIIAPSGLGFLVHKDVPKLGRVGAVGTNLTRVQLTSGSLRRFTPLDVNPANVGTIIGSPARYADWLDAPIPLTPNEEIDALGVQSNAGAQRITIGCWFTDGATRANMGRPFTVRSTSSTTLTANAFTAFQPAFDNGIPEGEFALVGMRVISASALFFRVIPRGGPAFRPGGFAQQAQSDIPFDGSRYGDWGTWMTFSNVTPPQVEVFATAADTSEEVYWDLVQTG